MTTVSKTPKAALVTGASRGIGKAMPGEVRDGIRMVALGVTSDASVAEAVGNARGELGHVDLLGKNAGYALSGAAEESSGALAFRHQFPWRRAGHRCRSADEDARTAQRAHP